MAKKIILSQEEIQNLINLYNEGNSLRTISKITGHSRNFITKVFNENNFIRRTNKINSRKYYLNDNYFEIIDNAEKAYWVGFIAADGYISKREGGCSNRLGITLSEKDIEHLYKFNKCLNSTYEIKTYKADESHYNINSRFCRLLMSSDKLVSDLEKLGIVEQKTLILKFPTIDQIPEQFVYDYIRGYMDGDGSISFCTKGYTKPSCLIGFTGQKDFLLNIQKYLGVKTKLTTKDNITFQFNIGGNNQCLNILNKLYKNSTENSRLNRKYEKYLELINIAKARV